MNERVLDLSGVHCE